MQTYDQDYNNSQNENLLFSLFAIFLIYFFKPVYDYFGHMGQAPLPPFGWSDVPFNVPVTEDLYNLHYRDSANQILSAMEKYRLSLGNSTPVQVRPIAKKNKMSPITLIYVKCVNDS